jgi:hypothetical protein
MNELRAPTALVPDHQPVPGELRIGWRLPTLLLIVEKCWGERASWTQMHVMSWSLLQRKSSEQLQQLLAGGRGPEEIVGIDPAVNRTVDIALGEGLLKLAGQRVTLTDKGRQVIARVREDDALRAERDTLDGVSGKVTDQAARSALKGAT